MRRWNVFFPVPFNIPLDRLGHDGPHWCLYLLRSVVSLEPWFPENWITRSHYLNLLFFFWLRLILFCVIECRVIVRLYTGPEDRLLADWASIVDQQGVVSLFFMHIVVDPIDLLVESGKCTQTVVFVAEDVCELVQCWIRIGLSTCESHTGCNQS
jgi:hypothetical protein